jgi:hypothetical protein
MLLNLIEISTDPDTFSNTHNLLYNLATTE